MTYFEDLNPCNYFGDAEGLLAVGWLDADHEFNRGPVTGEAFENLARLLVAPWQPFASAGREPCGFCRFTGGPTQMVVGDLTVPIGANNLFVPGDGTVFVAPSLVLHYIDAHGYSPPEVFMRALRDCPPTRSLEYVKAIRARGLHLLDDSRGTRT